MFRSASPAKYTNFSSFHYIHMSLILIQRKQHLLCPSNDRNACFTSCPVTSLDVIAHMADYLVFMSVSPFVYKESFCHISVILIEQVPSALSFKNM